MSKKPIGTEIKIKGYSNYNVFMGSMDKSNPTALYVRITSWAIPIDYDDNINYSREISKMTKRVKQFLYNTTCMDTFDKSKTLVDLDMRESGISKNKASFISCEFTLFQKEVLPIRNKKLYGVVTNLVSDLLDSIFREDEHFNFYRKKSLAISSISKAINI